MDPGSFRPKRQAAAAVTTNYAGRFSRPFFVLVSTHTERLSFIPHFAIFGPTGMAINGRLFMAQKRYIVRISGDCCKGCQLCISVCPKNVLGMAKKLNSKGHHHADALRIENCIGCLQCADICPDAAIEIDVEEVTR